MPSTVRVWVCVRSTYLGCPVSGTGTRILCTRSMPRLFVAVARTFRTQESAFDRKILKPPGNRSSPSVRLPETGDSIFIIFRSGIQFETGSKVQISKHGRFNIRRTKKWGFSRKWIYLERGFSKDRRPKSKHPGLSPGADMLGTCASYSLCHCHGGGDQRRRCQNADSRARAGWCKDLLVRDSGGNFRFQRDLGRLADLAEGHSADIDHPHGCLCRRGCCRTLLLLLPPAEGADERWRCVKSSPPIHTRLPPEATRAASV